MLVVPYFKQNRYYTCGPVCLRMVLAYWGYETDEISLSMLCGTNVFGTSAKQLLNAAQQLGFKGEYRFKCQYSILSQSLRKHLPLIVAVDPNIIYQRQRHSYAKHDIVILEAKRDRIIYHDPEVGPNLSVLPAIFKDAWKQAQKEAILIWPAEETITKRLKR